MPAATSLLAGATLGAQPGITPPPGFTTIGQGTLSFSTSGPLCLATGTTASTTSTPCAEVWLTTTAGTTASTLGTSSSAAGPIALSLSTSAYLSVKASNLNQLWLTNSGGTTNSVGYLYFVP